MALAQMQDFWYRSVGIGTFTMRGTMHGTIGHQHAAFEFVSIQEALRRYPMAPPLLAIMNAGGPYISVQMPRKKKKESKEESLE